MNAEERLAALNQVLDRCRSSRLYRDKLPNRALETLGELQTLPLTSKDELKAASPFGNLCVPASELYQYHETFGTTGTPTSSWFTRQDIVDNADQVGLGGVGFRADDIVLIRFPYAISSAAHIFHAAAQKRGACVIPASSRSTVSPFSRVIEMMRRLRVTILAGLPLQVQLLAETARLMGFDPRKDFPSLRAIYTAGESLSPVRRDVLSETWGVTAYNFYGLTELGNVAADCIHRNMHVADDFFLVEVLSSDFRTPAAEGEVGQLVITTLRREASPVIRYVTGDLARLHPGVCACGRDAWLEVRGRACDQVHAAGKAFDIWALEELLSGLPFHDYWAVAPGDDGLQFVVEELYAGETIDPKVVERLAREYGVGLTVRTAPKGTLYDRDELLAIGIVGKPRYVYTSEEFEREAYVKSRKM